MKLQSKTEEIKEHLERAQNPLFYYDNDTDGLCSFLILRRYIGRGKGVAVRSFPDLNASYARKARELESDYVFVLDKPKMSREFVEEIDNLGLPLVWIDHHKVEREDFESEFKNFYCYNSTDGGGEGEEPTTYLMYELTGKKEEDMWIAMMGCIADHYLPDFSSDFKEKYPDLWAEDVKNPFDAYYGTEIGKAAQALNFGLKDSTSNIVKLQNFLISCKGPRDVFSEVAGNFEFRRKYKELRKKYDQLLKEAMERVESDLVFFSYGGTHSISSDIANELSYKYPEKYIAVAYKKGAASNISLRGRNVRGVLERVLENFENASGGGHEDAVGARIQTEDLGRFKEVLKEEISREKDGKGS